MSASYNGYREPISRADEKRYAAERERARLAYIARKAIATQEARELDDAR